MMKARFQFGDGTAIPYGIEAVPRIGESVVLRGIGLIVEDYRVNDVAWMMDARGIEEVWIHITPDPGEAP